MNPKRNQHPPQARRSAKPVSPVFKVGDYVPLAILIVAEDKLKNFHLPQKLIALKDFVQADVMLEYFFQHPQQPLMLDPNRPKPAEFNGAVCNFHRWMIERGYCRQEGTTDVTARIWTQEEMQVARDEAKAKRDAQILAHAEAMAAAGDEGMDISQGINNLLGAAEQLTEVGTKLYAEGSMDKQEHAQVNVGTIGHVDHGLSGVTRALERVDTEQELVSQRSLTPDPVAYERQAGASADLPEAYLTQERPAHELDALLVNPDPATSFLLDVSAEVVRRAPQYPVIEKSDVHLADVDNRIHERDADLRPLSESGTHYPELQGKSREELDAHFGDRVVSDAELLAADPKGGL